MHRSGIRCGEPCFVQIIIIRVILLHGRAILARATDYKNGCQTCPHKFAFFPCYFLIDNPSHTYIIITNETIRYKTITMGKGEAVKVTTIEEINEFDPSAWPSGETFFKAFHMTNTPAPTGPKDAHYWQSCARWALLQKYGYLKDIQTYNQPEDTKEFHQVVEEAWARAMLNQPANVTAHDDLADFLTSNGKSNHRPMRFSILDCAPGCQVSCTYSSESSQNSSSCVRFRHCLTFVPFFSGYSSNYTLIPTSSWYTVSRVLYTKFAWRANPLGMIMIPIPKINPRSKDPILPIYIGHGNLTRCTRANGSWTNRGPSTNPSRQHREKVVFWLRYGVDRTRTLCRVKNRVIRAFKTQWIPWIRNYQSVRVVTGGPFHKPFYPRAKSLRRRLTVVLCTLIKIYLI